MLFILKKKKEKKMLATKKHSSCTHSAPNWKGEESHRKIPEGPSVGRTFIYELFKDYFHTTASGIEELAVRDTCCANPIDF